MSIFIKALTFSSPKVQCHTREKYSIKGRGDCMKKGDLRGFSLVELMIAAGIFLIAFVGILVSYMACLELNQISKNTSIAVHASKARLEAIKNTAFSQIKATYNNVTFTAAGLNGIGVSYVDDSNPRLIKITVSFSWKQPSGRVIGEDTNLNGQIDGSEDKNSNGILDSPVELVTYVFQ